MIFSRVKPGFQPQDRGNLRKVLTSIKPGFGHRTEKIEERFKVEDVHVSRVSAEGTGVRSMRDGFKKRDGKWKRYR